MLTKERRPMTETERKMVQEAVSSVTKRKRWVDYCATLLVGFGCCFITSGFLIFLALAIWEWLAKLLHKPGFSPTTDTCLIFCFVAGLVGATVVGRLEYQNHCEARRKAEKMAQAYQRDLDEGEAEARHCEVARVVQLEEQEDEGPGFFLELAPGQVMFMQGQYLYDLLGNDFSLEDDGEISKPRHDDVGIWPPPPRTASSTNGCVFPCQRFDLVYATNSRLLLDLMCQGERFAGWPTHSLPSEMYLTKNRYPEDGEILTVSPVTLDADLIQWATVPKQEK